METYQLNFELKCDNKNNLCGRQKVGQRPFSISEQHDGLIFFQHQQQKPFFFSSLQKRSNVRDPELKVTGR